MLIIFGWGRVTSKVLCVIGLKECQHCHRVSQWQYQRKRVWFTLFFIPCIPYDTTFWVGCQHCQYGYAVVEDVIAGRHRVRCERCHRVYYTLPVRTAACPQCGEPGPFFADYSPINLVPRIPRP